MEQGLIPGKYRVLSGSALKLIAVVTMLIDHIGFALLSQNPIVLFSAFGYSVTLYSIARSIGRIAFPIFAFLLVEGFLHTRNRLRYAIGLGVFALLSEIPFNLIKTGTLWNWHTQNVFFTLLFGLLGVWAVERFSDRPWKALIGLLAMLLAAYFAHSDYDVSGYCFILLLYVLRKSPVPRAIIGTVILPSKWKAGLAFIPIAFYNGKRGFIRGSVLKFVFYLFYPAHLLILWWIRRKLFGF